MKIRLVYALMAVTSVSFAGVNLDFSVASTNTGTARLNAGNSLVFDFTIDGSGNVALVASTGATDSATTNTVNGWDGVVGSVTDASLFNTAFQLTVSGKRAGSANAISLDGYQGGQLGVYGQNASRIDGATLATPAIEALEWELTSGGNDIEISEWVYAANNNVGDSIVYDNDSGITNFNMAGETGTNLLSEITLAGGEVLGFTQPTNGNHGFGVAGFSFDIVPAPLPLTTGIVDVVFDNDLTGWVIDVPIRLDYSVNETGVVSLNASTSSSDPAAIAAVDEWDGPKAQFTNSLTFNSSFSLQVAAVTANGGGRVVLTDIDPGGLGIQGQNSNRIDGLGLATPNAETLRISTSTGAAKVRFNSVEWYNGSNGTEMTAALPTVVATNVIAASGVWNLTGTNFVAASGEALDLSLAWGNGYTLSGFSFELTTPPVPSPRTNGFPNVVVILADDLGYSDISHNPFHGPEVSTPNIDNLISSGVWFSDAYASGNICAPSRTGFLSGCYQQRLGVHHEGNVNAASFSSTFPYFPQHLKQQFDGIEDYAAIMVGKWHQNRDRTATVSIDGNSNGVFTEDEFDYGFAVPETLKYNPLKRGFDEVYGFIDLGGSSYWNYGRGFYDQFYRHEYDAPIDGIDDGDALETYMTTRFTEEACDFIEKQSASNNPFFVYLSYNAVHTPMEAPSSPAGLSEGDPGWFPDATWYSNNFPNMWQSPTYFKASDLDTQTERDALQATRAILMAMLYHMDQGIGQVVDTLKTNGVWDNTIVIFWSDNGGAKASGASNNPLHEQKHFNYEGGIRVPMSISWPDGLGAYSNTTVSAPVMSIDILPTVLDLVDIEPMNGFDAFDGKSLLPLIRGEVENVHDSLCWSEGGETGEYSIRQGDWKLYIDEGVYELYNLAADIGETNDLSATFPDRVRQMRQKFFSWMSEMVDASGDVLDDRLWSYTTPPDTNASAIDIQTVEILNGSLEVEYDEMEGWLTNGPVFEATHSLTTNSWAPVAPATFEQLDRYLDQSTYRVSFSADLPQQYFRIKVN